MKKKKTKEEMMEAFDRQLRIKRGERAESPKEILENAERFINTELAFEPKVSKEHDKEERRKLVEDVQNLTDEQFETLPEVMRRKLKGWKERNKNQPKTKAFKEWTELQEQHATNMKNPIWNYPDEGMPEAQKEQIRKIKQSLNVYQIEKE